MPDLSRNLVHLRWLLKLVEFRAAVMGTVSLSIFTSSSGPPIYIPTHNELIRWNHLASYARLPASLEDIRLLLDQQSEAQFQWTPYEDPAIRVVIPNEYFQNPNAWHVKVALVNYATVEMHQSDRVLRQFGFRQPIPVAPERFWSHYIQIWEDRYDYIPTRKPIIVLELACVPEYMHGLGSMASRIYCRQRRDSGNYVSKGNDVSL
ncbi:hypothetical protein Goshw_001606 [Gossypium schwendimanii]|uniref:Aminotransferase-like plant mobile domain-containing protein n=1 Tax=Gossypium schwendimanii TaxID=34291 RepID=A0A7J9N010_GOSSC|nr:hypothetical protein [Gossypium schwendimanii]